MTGWLLFFPRLFLLFFSLLYLVSSIVLYTRGFFLTVRVMRDSITAWSARCDTSVIAEILSLIVREISVAFCNFLRWSRSHGSCVKHEMIWWCNRLHKYRREIMELVTKVVLLKTEGSVSGGWISSGRSIPREEAMVSGTFWMILYGKSLKWLSLLVSLGDSGGERHMSWSWCGL